MQLSPELESNLVRAALGIGIVWQLALGAKVAQSVWRRQRSPGRAALLFCAGALPGAFLPLVLAAALYQVGLWIGQPWYADEQGYFAPWLLPALLALIFTIFSVVFALLFVILRLCRGDGAVDGRGEGHR